MQQQPSNYSDLTMALGPITRQLDRLEAKVEERTRDIVTRTDLEALRKELVARDSLEPQMAALRMLIERVNTDRVEDKRDINKRMDDLEDDQVSRQERLWMRLGPIVGILGFILALFEFLSHLRFLP